MGKQRQGFRKRRREPEGPMIRADNSRRAMRNLVRWRSVKETGHFKPSADAPTIASWTHREDEESEA